MADRVINQGDIYFVDLGEPFGSEPGFLRPYVVIQNDIVNASSVHTVAMCALTTNMRRATARGNVTVDAGEGGLPERSVVNVSQLVSFDRARLTDYYGTLSPSRMQQVVDGIIQVIEPRKAPGGL